MTNTISAESQAARRREALAPLLAAHLDLVYAAALRQTRDPHMAEDVAQSVFLIAVKKAGHIPQDRAAAWLLKVTRYVALTALRAQRCRAYHERGAALETSAQADSSQAALEGHVDEALAALGQSDRQMILLRYFQNHSVPEVAAAFRIADNTASQRLGRALDKLRHYLLRRHVNVPLTALGSMLALAVRPAPRALAQRILQAAGAGKVSAAAGISLGVFLMTLTTKTTLVLSVAAILLLATIAGVYVGRPPASAAPVAAAATRGPGLEALPIVPEEPPAANAVPQYTFISGTVTDEAGMPVANALVSQGDPPFLVDGYYTTRSDAEGKFEVQAKVGTELVLAAQLAGYAPELVKQGMVTPTTSPLKFALKPAQTLRFRIVDKRGNPVANLGLDPFYWRGTQLLRTNDGQRNFPRSDANGMVVWQNAPTDAVTFDPITGTYLRKNFTLTASDTVQTVALDDPITVSITATDEETKMAIPNFSVTYGRGSDSSQVDYWGDRAPETGVDGKYLTSIKMSSAYHYFRIEAPGYASVVETFKEDHADVTLNVRLSKTTGLTIDVRRPDGTPAARVPVYVVPSEQGFNLNEYTRALANPELGFRGKGRNQNTDASGHIVVVDMHDPAARILVVDEAGFADVLLADAVKSRSITLDEWARLEGVAFVGAKSAAEQKIQVQYMPQREGKPYVTGFFEAATDGSGRFSFARLPSGRMIVGREVQANAGSVLQSGTITNYVVLTLVGGKTVQVTIGGKGRPVAGRIVDDTGSVLEDVIYSLASLRNNVPEVEPPAEFAKKLEPLRQLPREEALARFEELKKSPEYAALQKADEERTAKQRSYAFAIAADGAFRAEDIDPGEYAMSVTVWDAKTFTERGVVKAMVTVPAGADGKVVPLGDLRMTPPK